MTEPRMSIGKVLSPHGVRGEVKVMLFADLPHILQRNKQFWIDSKSDALEIEAIREQKNHFLVKFIGVDNRDESENLTNSLLQIPREELPQLPSGEYYHFEIIGLTVYEMSGEIIGVVHDILKTGANDVYVVKRDGKNDLLIPALKKIILEIDVPNNRMKVDLPLGLE